jgi:hypothetical protein
VRVVYLIIAAVAVVVTVFAHGWGAGKSGDEDLDVGLRTVHTCDGDDCDTHDADDFYGLDDAAITEGMLTSVALGAAALAMLVAASMVRNGPIELAPRILLATPLVIAVMSSMVFTSRITRGDQLNVAWCAIVAVTALVIGMISIFVQPRHDA